MSLSSGGQLLTPAYGPRGDWDYPGFLRFIAITFTWTMRLMGDAHSSRTPPSRPRASARSCASARTRKLWRPPHSCSSTFVLLAIVTSSKSCCASR